jgi:hypothetical protein
MLLIAAASRPLSGQNVPTPPATVDWGVLNQLVGHWIADSGGGHPGATTRAEEVFTLELGGRILVRHDFSEYASANGAQATRHDGLLIFYPIGSRAFAAHSYDNEGHVIDYAVVASDGVITLTSAALAGTPRFRLTYLPDNATMRIRFEIASPGQPEAFQLYVSGTTHRAPQ